MNPRQRMDAAMRPAVSPPPDRVPVMCQLALGHYFLHGGIPAVDIWHDSAAFATALLTLRGRYGFDGILVNLPGRDPKWETRIDSMTSEHGETTILWREGYKTIVPPDENPRVLDQIGRRWRPPRFEDVTPDALFYIEPHGRLGVTPLEFFPPWQFDTMKKVREAAPDVSVHGEVFSPFSQLVELLGPADAMLALVDDAAKVRAMLERLAVGATALALGLLEAGADAIVISSAFAGGGFISPAHYEEFVLPFERALIAAIKVGVPRAIVYTHTCGAIGDRLELMEATGTDGIDTLDPPPLGTCDLADARRRLSARLFIKGNIDPVNTVLRGTPDDCRRAALERIAAAGSAGYILSTACSVPPRAPAENILALASVATEVSCPS
jgi:hypothetical protein